MTLLLTILEDGVDVNARLVSELIVRIIKTRLKDAAMNAIFYNLNVLAFHSLFDGMIMKGLKRNSC